MWADGAQVKAIAHATDMSPSAIKEERLRLRLPPRNKPAHVKTNAVSVYFDDVTWAKLRRAAFGRYASIPNYIRGLVLRDVGD